MAVSERLLFLTDVMFLFLGLSSPSAFTPTDIDIAGIIHCTHSLQHIANLSTVARPNTANFDYSRLLLTSDNATFRTDL